MTTYLENIFQRPLFALFQRNVKMDTDDNKNEKYDEYKSKKKYKIIVLGLVVHCLMLFAVFDIYFASPLEHGMTPIKSTHNPPAKRLVLFVADGLRAEAVYGKNKEDRIPFLSKIAAIKGSWGVAHTRVPTESRPGHVAMLGGIYEDPSAIMKGWKANPVYFDSVINESTNAWCWGSPDIMNIFNKDNLPHIHLESYDAEIEDFGQNNTGVLDMWVFDKVEKFLTDIKNCKTNCDVYHKDGNFFFLHLLGIDTAGHGFKPHSNEYINNIKLVDDNIKKISKRFEDIFYDHSTAYVFTSDHGMTDWGSHGTGSEHETEAPVIVWGAGIQTNPLRQDISQIDLAPLMCSIMGVSIPTNSLGKVPLTYLKVSERTAAEIQLSNTLQLLEIYNLKKMRIEDYALIDIPYNGSTAVQLQSKIERLKNLLNIGKYSELIVECNKTIDMLRDGLDYYHNYYRYPVLFAISLGFIGWILFLLTTVMNLNLSNVNDLSKTNMYVYNSAILSIILLCLKHRFPLSYYIYFIFPVVMFQTSLRNIPLIFREINANSIQNCFIYIIGLELLVYGFFNRLSFSVLSILVGFWIYCTKSLKTTTNKKEKLLWLVLCLILSVFPALPVMKTTFNVPVYLFGAIAWLVLFYEMYCRMKFYNQFESFQVQYKVFQIQLVCLILAIVYVLLLEKEIIPNDSMFKYLSWVILLLPISLIPLTSKFVAARLIATFFAFAPFYLLVSSNFEALFSAFYVGMLCNWLILESNSLQIRNAPNLIYHMNFDNYHEKSRVTSDMVRRAFLFVVFIFLGFFGTGNIASLNSFDPMWVRAFLTVFSPFKMMGLILLKIMVPFIFSCCIFRAINSIGKEDIMKMFCIILIFSDLMVLQFLFLIQNTGSWLDIGSSLSHFVIMEGFVTILLILYGFAHIITTVKYTS